MKSQFFLLALGFAAAVTAEDHNEHDPPCGNSTNAQKWSCASDSIGTGCCLQSAGKDAEFYFKVECEGACTDIVVRAEAATGVVDLYAGTDPHDVCCTLSTVGTRGGEEICPAINHTENSFYVTVIINENVTNAKLIITSPRQGLVRKVTETTTTTQGALASCPGRKLGNDKWYLFTNEPMKFGEAEDFCRRQNLTIATIETFTDYFVIHKDLVGTNIGSSWVSRDFRPENFSTIWKSYFEEDEPNQSGLCLYLSGSNNYRYGDTSCDRAKRPLCQKEDSSCGELISDMRCTTEDGTLCVLPFIYQGECFNGCTTRGDSEGKPWCSTKTDTDLNHAGENHWGYCKLGKCPFYDTENKSFFE